MKHDAEIWLYHEPKVGYRAEGSIFNDTKTGGYHPFNDGKWVSTSGVKEIVKDGTGEFLVTHNTVYKIIGQKMPLSERAPHTEQVI